MRIKKSIIQKRGEKAILKKKIFIIIIIILAILTFSTFQESKANQEINIIASENKIQLENEVTITIKTNQTPIAAIDLSIFYDKEKLEFTSGPQNLKQEENEIKYSWFDEDGGENNITEREILSVEFKAIKEGIANIGISGTAYDKDGNILDINFNGTEIEIGKIQNQEELINVKGTESTDESQTNSKLQNLRLNEEGLEPEFNSEIYNYYFTTDKEINSLEVTAIPQNINANVTITGNTNIKYGKNEIKIEVISQDKTNKNEYIINVVKTKDLEKANTNLEILAIEGQFLYPEFAASISVYNVTVSNNTENLKILAVPENIKATVEKRGEESLQIGENLVEIEVKAEDGISEKTYQINIHRRTEEEEKIAQKEAEEQREKLAKLLSTSQESEENKETENDEKNNENKEKSKEEKNKILIWTVVSIIIIVTITIAVRYFFRKEKKNKKRTLGTLHFVHKQI